MSHKNSISSHIGRDDETEGEMALKDPTEPKTSSPTKKTKRKSSSAISNGTSTLTTSTDESPKTPKSTKNKVSISVANLESPQTPKSSSTTKRKSLLKAPASAPGRTSTKVSTTGDLKTKGRSSIGKYSQKYDKNDNANSSSNETRPSWWNLDDPNLLFLASDSDDDDDNNKQNGTKLTPEEIQRRNEQVMQYRDKYERELRSSVRLGTVFKLLEEARRKERDTKPVVLPNVRAQPLKIDISKFEPPSFKQETEQKTLVKDVAKKNFILKDFVATGAKTDIRKLVKAFEPVQVGKGKTIVQQGEQDDHFYVVEDGTVEFQVDNITVRTAGAGSTFGDHNLLYQAPSNETVKASDGNPIKLLRLNHSTYRGIMQTTEQAKKIPPPSTPPPAPSPTEAPSDDWLTNSKELNERKAIRAAVKTHVKSSNDLDHIKVLGEGQFGEVWLVATNLPGVAVPKGKTQHEFALKIQRNLRDPRMVQNIRNEIKTMEAFDHPFISSFYHHYDNEDSIDMLLGLIPGGDLWEVVHKENEETGEWLSGIPETHAQFYSMVIADTLSYIHDQGYIFRDLKPENVMVDAKGYPIIVDFGFAKKCPTKTYTFCGTPNYVAPEIVKNLGHDAAVDWWALGVVIYEMISGENPFYYDGLDSMDLYEAICEDKPEPLKEGFSESVVDLINKLLIKDPDKRLGSGKKRGKEILNHRFFTGLNLKRMRLKKIKAPWIPGEDKDTTSTDFEIQRQKEIQVEAEQRAFEESALRKQEEQERQDREAERLKQEELLRLRRLEEEERERCLAEQRAREQEELREKQREEVRQRQRYEERERQKQRDEELRLQRLEEEERERRLAEQRAREQEEERERKREEVRRRRREDEQRLERIRQEEEDERLRLEQERQKKKEEEERRYREEERRLQKEEEERKRREKEHEERLKSEKIRQEREKGEEKARLAREREELERLEFEHLEASVRRQKEIDEEKEHRKEMRRLKKESDKEIKLELERELSFSFRDDEGGLPIDDEFRSQRRASFDQSWSEAVSPAPNGTKKKVDVGHVPKGIVAKLVNGQGKAPKSPTTLYSPRVQEELNKSIGKGLVAQRLSTAKAKEKLGGSIPSMFSSFDL